MRTYTPKIGRHVTYITTTGKRRPATITGVTSATVVDLRIGHFGEVYLGVNKVTDDDQVNRWKVAKAHSSVTLLALFWEDDSLILLETDIDNLAQES
jgi:hypothetical protein